MNPVLGGIVGALSDEPTASLEINYSYSTSKLKVNTSTSGIESMASVGGLVANEGIGTDATATGRKVSLSYCYTTSTVEAIVYDSRKVGNIDDYLEASKSSTAG